VDDVSLNINEPADISLNLFSDLSKWGNSLLNSGKGSFNINTEGWIKWGNNTIEQVTEDEITALKLTYVDNGNGAYAPLQAEYDIIENLTVNSIYRIRARIKDNGEGRQHLRVFDGDSGWTNAGLLTESWTWYEIKFTAAHATNARVQFDLNVTGIIYVDQWIIQKEKAFNDISISLNDISDISVNIPGTLAYGNSLVDPGKGDFSTDDDKESWQINASNTWNVADSALKVTYVDGDLGARIIFSDAMDLISDLTPGETYKVSVRYKVVGAFKFQIYRGFGEDTVDSDEVTSATYKWITLEFVCVNADGDDLRLIEFGEGDIVYIDRWLIQKKL